MDFTGSAIPDETVFERMQDESPHSGDPVCRVCQTPLAYGGRGRKPVLCDTHKSKGTSSAKTGARASSDVESALTILGGLYDGLAMGLTMVSPQAASVWVSRIDGLQSSNRAVLSVDKELCRKINTMARGGGKFAFFAAHAMAMAPVIMIVKAETGPKKRTARPADSAQSLFIPDSIPTDFFT